MRPCWLSVPTGDAASLSPRQWLAGEAQELSGLVVAEAPDDLANAGDALLDRNGGSRGAAGSVDPAGVQHHHDDPAGKEVESEAARHRIESRLAGAVAVMPAG